MLESYWGGSVLLGPSPIQFENASLSQVELSSPATLQQLTTSTETCPPELCQLHGLGVAALCLDVLELAWTCHAIFSRGVQWPIGNSFGRV